MVFTRGDHHNIFPVLDPACILRAGADYSAVLFEAHCPVRPGGYLNQSVTFKRRNILSRCHKRPFFRNIHRVGCAERKPVRIGQLHFCGTAPAAEQVDCRNDQHQSGSASRNRKQRAPVHFLQNGAEVKAFSSGLFRRRPVSRFRRFVFFRFFFLRFILNLIDRCLLEDDGFIVKIPFRFGRNHGFRNQIVRKVFGLLRRNRRSRNSLQGIRALTAGKGNLDTVIILIQTRQCYGSRIVREIFHRHAVNVRKLKQLVDAADRVAVLPVHIFRYRDNKFFRHVTLRIAKMLPERCKFFGKSVCHT